MTTSTWDEQQIRTKFGECQTLRDVIMRLESDFTERGEVICEIRVNGTLLSEDDEVKFAESRASEIRDLAIGTKRPGDLIREAIASAQQFVPELETACLETAEAFRGSDLARAQKTFHECLEGCQWLVDTLLHARGAASGLGQPILQPERWFDGEKILGRVVRELSDAYTKEDFVLVADLLEYELSGALEIWKETLKNEVAR